MNIKLLYSEENKKKKKFESFYEIWASSQEELYDLYNELSREYGLVVYLSSNSIIRREFMPIPNKDRKEEDGYYHAYVRI